jgi:MSHA biogenesis protein MshP
MRSMRGFSLPTAIFLLVILALLGAFMVSLSTSQAITSTQDLQGARAYRAAQGGLQRALFSLKGATTCAGAGFDLTLTVDGFSVEVKCKDGAHEEGGTQKYIFWVTSTATVPGAAIGSISYVERELNTFVEF